ncbi:MULTISPECIES: hypothetical protein [Snodgrassella]|uniref:hypothetical protein n=1 Tax=Snodgrassella TaxID=1193515 RepID=UPI0004D36C63|nr:MULTISPECIES: hypothetical protein [Snodgrassella]KES10078.1 hypothetical protein SASC598O11_013090 [Snodgrassella alvi SCGC AB-598-O11]MBI0067058.1 hypothetical protein [Snodgrassella sp. M0110]MBI0076023.1 hypothetical protein [Snodgrassella sp. M0118]MBI0078359.1 hypothetical protein [Snodgrassella sp. M0112]
MSKSDKLNIAQQRELLDIQAQGTRLKLLAEQLKNGDNTHKSRLWQRSLNIVDKIPAGGLALKLANKPKRWRNKLLVGAVLTAATLIANKISRNIR